METKKCNKCGETKAISHFQIDSRIKDGHRNKCNECVSEYMAAYYARKYDEASPKIKMRIEQKVKKCNVCNETKGFSHFNKSQKSPDGHAYTCSVCNAKNVEEYRKEENEKIQQKTQLPNGYAAKRERYIKHIEAIQKQHTKTLQVGKLVYVSLPIGYGKLPRPEQEQLARKRAAVAADKLRALGYQVITPFTLGIPPTYTYTEALETCLAMMQRYRPIMFFLDGWRSSNGCYTEFNLALDMKLTTEQEAVSGFRFMEDRARDLCIHPDCAFAV